MDVIGIFYLVGGKETVEKALLVDVLCWSIDEPPPAFVIFIIGNIDLSNVIHKLTQRTYGVLLVCDCALRMGKSMLAGVIEWVEWSSVLQLLPVLDFDAMRDMIIPAYTESTYFNPMGVVTENAGSLPQPLLAIADLILNIFPQYKWIGH